MGRGDGSCVEASNRSAGRTGAEQPACIASYLGTISGLVSEVGRLKTAWLALLLFTKSSILLRQSLERTAHPLDLSLSKSIFPYVYFLHRPSVTTGDQALTGVYGLLLDRLVSRCVLEGTVQYVTLFHAAINNVDASAKFMCRTSFDCTWFAQIHAHMWKIFELELRRVSIDICDGNKSGKEEEQREDK